MGRFATAGPVFDSEEYAIARANDTEYGLAAHLHTQDSRRIYRAFQFGMVAVNRTVVKGATIPFSGKMQSRLGHEGTHLVMEPFTEVKHVCRAWADRLIAEGRLSRNRRPDQA